MFQSVIWAEPHWKQHKFFLKNIENFTLGLLSGVLFCLRFYKSNCIGYNVNMQKIRSITGKDNKALTMWLYELKLHLILQKHFTVLFWLSKIEYIPKETAKLSHILLLFLKKTLFDVPFLSTYFVPHHPYPLLPHFLFPGIIAHAKLIEGNIHADSATSMHLCFWVESTS